jgi:hypothetical protein
MLKGHFWCAVDPLQRHFPDARFLTIVREPAPGLKSSINFLRVNPAGPVLGKAPWEFLAQALVKTEEVYCKVEQAKFSNDAGDPNKCHLRCTDFCSDLESSLKFIYNECLDVRPLPDSMAKTHPSRKRTHYTVNKSLAELHIDESALDERLASYISWCRRGSEKTEKKFRCEENARWHPHPVVSLF